MEIWKDVKGAEGSYMISSSGRLKSCARYVVNNVHGGKRFIPEKILSRKKVNSSGYFNTQLNFGGFSISVYLHRLVAEHFIPKIKGKNFVNHKNGIKTDNRVENLEWCTEKENIHHSINLGLSNLKSSSKKVIDLESKKIYESVKDAAIKNGYNTNTFTAMLNGRLVNKTNFCHLQNVNN